MNAIQKLRQLSDEVQSADGLKIVDAWATIARLLPRSTTEQEEAARIVRDQDAEALAALIDRIDSPPPAPKPAGEATAKEKKDAMHAFRKRLKLARLNDESKLGGRYTSGGKTSKIDSVEPPNEYPRRVWQALAAEGKLVDTGKGFYADAEDRRT